MFDFKSLERDSSDFAGEALRSHLQASPAMYQPARFVDTQRAVKFPLRETPILYTVDLHSMTQD